MPKAARRKHKGGYVAPTGEYALTPEEVEKLKYMEDTTKGQRAFFNQAWKPGDVNYFDQKGNLNEMNPAQIKALAVRFTKYRNDADEEFKRKEGRSFWDIIKDDYIPLITHNQTISNVAGLAADLAKDLPGVGEAISGGLKAVQSKTDTGTPWLQSIGVTNEGDTTKVPLLGWGLRHRRMRKKCSIKTRTRKH